MKTDRLIPARDLEVGTPPPHALPIGEVTSRLGTDPERGLSRAEAQSRRAADGPNVLRESPPPPLWRKVARHFASLLIGLLFVAAIISGWLGDWPETLSILAIILLNGIIGFLQEERAERALSALRKLSAPTCRVRRDGRERSMAAGDLVRGDLILVEAGDQAPADARLVKSIALSTQESALTGESAPVSKDADALLAADTALGDRANVLHAGTSVASGKGTAIVVATGMNTELGRIAGLLEKAENEPTPLQRRLTLLGRYLIVLCLALVAIIFALNVARGHPPMEVFLFSVSLAVAAVPEGLPAVVTIALALGVHRMARRQALVRNLPAVETLGCVTVICSDKTGTLTRNEMTVREVWTATGRYRVGGAGYSTDGEFERDGPPSAAADPVPRSDGRALEDADLRRAIRIGAACNNAQVHCADDGSCAVIGDPTEAALLVLAEKAEIDASRGERMREIPFDSDRKAMSVVVREPGGAASLFMKGAVEVVLERCSHVQRDGQPTPLTRDHAAAIHAAATEMGRRALRVLALAWREVDRSAADRADESELVFAGLVGMIDPPRGEARHAVQRCRDAGIRAVMITGDHPETALAVARELRMIGDDEHVLTGAQLDRTTDDELAERAERAPVYARVTAEHKLRVVRALRSRGHVAAMTGDGVNDAAAVKAADIGVAMGRTGTDVTRGASDMVLLDDNFASIVAAVEEGRGIFDNIQKVTHYLLSCNAGELMLLFFAALAGWPAPLLAVQILWINLITDGVPALALAVEPPERGIMRRRPRAAGAALISRSDTAAILWHGLLIAAAAACGFAWLRGESDAALDEARAGAFSIAAFSQLFFAIGCRSRRFTMPQIGWFTNPALFWAIAASVALQIGVTSIPLTREFLKTEPLAASDWGMVIGLSLVPVTIVEATKLLFSALRHEQRPSQTPGPAPTP